MSLIAPERVGELAQKALSGARKTAGDAKRVFLNWRDGIELRNIDTVITELEDELTTRTNRRGIVAHPSVVDVNERRIADLPALIQTRKKEYTDVYRRITGRLADKYEPIVQAFLAENDPEIDS